MRGVTARGSFETSGRVAEHGVDLAGVAGEKLQRLGAVAVAASSFRAAVPRNAGHSDPACRGTPRRRDSGGGFPRRSGDPARCKGGGRTAVPFRRADNGATDPTQRARPPCAQCPATDPSSKPPLNSTAGREPFWPAAFGESSREARARSSLSQPPCPLRGDPDSAWAGDGADGGLARRAGRLDRATRRAAAPARRRRRPGRSARRCRSAH